MFRQRKSKPTWLWWGHFLTRWTARITAAFLLSIVLIIIVGEVFFGGGGPNFAKEGWRFCVMTLAGLTALAGCAMLWWRELWGGLLVLLGIAAFYGLNYLASGRFPGGLFPWFYLPGFLAIVSWLLSRWPSIASHPVDNAPE